MAWNQSAPPPAQAGGTVTPLARCFPRPRASQMSQLSGCFSREAQEAIGSDLGRYAEAASAFPGAQRLS